MFAGGKPVFITLLLHTQKLAIMKTLSIAQHDQIMWQLYRIFGTRTQIFMLSNDLYLITENFSDCINENNVYEIHINIDTQKSINENKLHFTNIQMHFEFAHNINVNFADCIQTAINYAFTRKIDMTEIFCHCANENFVTCVNALQHIQNTLHANIIITNDDNATEFETNRNIEMLKYCYDNTNNINLINAQNVSFVTYTLNTYFASHIDNKYLFVSVNDKMFHEILNHIDITAKRDCKIIFVNTNNNTFEI